MKKFISGNWFKLIIIICILLAIFVAWLYINYKIESDSFRKDLQCKSKNSSYYYNEATNRCATLILPETELPDCNFEIQDIQEYKGDFNRGDGHYINYEGVMKNKSKNRQYLKAMISKIYTADKILVSDGYTSIGDWVEPGVSIPFKVTSTVNGNKFFNESVQLSPDIYPWFLTCK